MSRKEFTFMVEREDDGSLTVSSSGFGGFVQCDSVDEVEQYMLRRVEMWCAGLTAAGHPKSPVIPAGQPDLLTLQQVAEHYNIAENSLRYWRMQGTGPKSARIGRRVMYRVADVQTWIAGRFAEEGKP